jgi:hypothetical protein
MTVRCRPATRSTFACWGLIAEPDMDWQNCPAFELLVESA